jgi:hypothetical protein
MSLRDSTTWSMGKCNRPTTWVPLCHEETMANANNTWYTPYDASIIPWFLWVTPWVGCQGDQGSLVLVHGEKYLKSVCTMDGNTMSMALIDLSLNYTMDPWHVAMEASHSAMV